MKKTLAAITLAIVMTMTATFANAGIIVGDRSPAECTTSAKDGIIILGRDGIIILGIVIWGEAPTTCDTTSEKVGIIVGD